MGNIGHGRGDDEAERAKLARTAAKTKTAKVELSALEIEAALQDGGIGALLPGLAGKVRSVRLALEESEGDGPTRPGHRRIYAVVEVEL